MKARLRCGTSGFFVEFFVQMHSSILHHSTQIEKFQSTPHLAISILCALHNLFFFCILNPRPVLISMAVKVQWSLLNAQPNGKRAALTIFQASSVTTTSVPTTMRIVLGVLPTRRSFKYVPKIWYFQGYLKQFGWVIRFIFDTSFFSLFVK